MRGVFDEEEDLEEERSGRDTELTLGAGMLLALFFGLVVVCGICFGAGYALGHRAASSQAVSAANPAMPAAASAPKPSASAQTPPAAAAPSPGASQPGAAADLPQATAAVALPINSAQPAAAGVPSAPANAAPANPQPPQAQPQVHPAFPAQPAAPSYASYPAGSAPAAAQPVRAAALPSQNQFWVQIAAVSHVEDAEVLTNALRRRGYTVTPRRELSDNLIHVRIGPFATRDEAANWRLKLLNDGYNAMIQP